MNNPIRARRERQAAIDNRPSYIGRASSPYRKQTPVKRSSDHFLGIIIALVVVGVIFVLGLGVVTYAKTSTVSFTLNEKESVTVRDSDGGSKNEYRLYTSAGTFKVGDSIVHPRFNSSDVYGRLKEGTNYSCKVYGFRVPLFSKFKNVLECQVR